MKSLAAVPVSRVSSAAISLLIGMLSAACTVVPPLPPGIGKAVTFADLDGWPDDRHIDSWPAFLESCRRLPARDPDWVEVCRAASGLEPADSAAVRAFYEHWLVPRVINGRDSGDRGLITGYYEPLLKGSMTASARYAVPLYRRPDDLVRIELGGLYPELAGKRVRGRLDGNTVVPYFDRATIDSKAVLAGSELVFVDSAIDAFFLHVQGSGKVVLENGERISVGYADQNGHPYRSIGRILVESGEMQLEDVNLFSLRKWLADHPQRARELLHANPSYVFFELRENADPRPVGSLNVPLTAGRSVATDPSLIDPGIPVWLETSYPARKDLPYRRLMMSQDTGGAITGPLRADIFFGTGDTAGLLAGHMRQPGRMYALQPATMAGAE